MRFLLSRQEEVTPLCRGVKIQPLEGGHYCTVGYIDGATKDRLVAEDPKSAEIIRPILRGRDIKRYTYDFKDLWLIVTHNGYKRGDGRVSAINVDNYPAVKRHLESYWAKIESRGDKGNTPYNLRNCAYMDDFSKQKIVWGNMCLKAQFAIADEGFMINAPSPLLTPAEPWLLAYLNSSPADWYIRSLGVTRNGGYFEYKPMFVENLPIPRFNDKQKNKLNLLCEMAQAEAGSGKCDASSKIDSYINSVLGLTPEECAFLQVD